MTNGKTLPLIECRNLSKRFYYYEHRTASLQETFVRLVTRKPLHIQVEQFQVRDLTMDVYAGESVAILGANGSGKSTALRLIAGIYPPTSGTVERRGRVVAVIELGAVFHSELTGQENAGLYAAALGLTRQEIAAAYPKIMTFAELGDVAERPMKYYSSGMRARLAFSVAMCSNPDVLLLDEILSVGDERFSQRCLDRLDEYRAANGTVIFVSHNSEQVRRICSRAMWLSHGSVQMSGPVEDVLDAYHRRPDAS